MPSSPSLPEIGEVVAGRFELRRVIGKGGMGVVYEALDRKRGEPCALKILAPQYGDRERAVARFDREARVTSKLRGPNVARVFDVGALPGDLRYIAMELLRGRELAAELRARGRLPIAVAVDIAIQTAHAMKEAHALGIIHRDLKPENLFLVEESAGSIVKVLDFGISRLVDDDEHLTADWAQLGTALYMSPEQIESPAGVDARTDVWSLGVVLYEMIVGKPPFEGEGTGALVAIATRPVAPPSSRVDDLPPELDAVLMRALEKSPDARFQSMEELARALSQWAPAGRRYRRRSRMRVAFVGVAALAVIGVAAVRFDVPSAFGLGREATTDAPSASALASAPSATSSSRSVAFGSSKRRAPSAHGSQSPHLGAQSPPSSRSTRSP